jgi:uncharacterized protein
MANFNWGTNMKSKFHSGEIAIQSRAGVRDTAERVSRVISTNLPHNAQYFLEMQRMVVIGTIDENDQVQASVLIGNPGFIHASDNKTILIDTSVIQDDSITNNIQNRNEIGILAIELAARLRLKVKGNAQLMDGSVLITIQRAYGQCPKYIQAREVESFNLEPRSKQNIKHSECLSEDLQDFIAVSDTFFIASYHQESGVDVSHRGGNPGFIKILNQNKILFPDYSGNSMFNTLGNISLNPGASLLFIDFEKGYTLKLNGNANIIWDQEQIAKFAGAERLVEFKIVDVQLSQGAVPIKWEFIEYSPFNPF